jgi:hypothetical protein
MSDIFQINPFTGQMDKVWSDSAFLQYLSSNTMFKRFTVAFGGQTVFSIPDFSVTTNSIVFKDGYQIKTGYTVTDEHTITFAVSQPEGTEIVIFQI